MELIGFKNWTTRFEIKEVIHSHKLYGHLIIYPFFYYSYSDPVNTNLKSYIKILKCN